MSSTAVLISGQMRTFSACVANLHWMVFKRLKDPMFFISCADDDQAADAHLLEGYYPGKVFIEKVKQPEMLPKLPFILARHAPYTPTPNNETVVRSILRQLWHYQRVWEFHKTFGVQFGVYVRCRPDLFFHRTVEATLPAGNEFFGPWKATCGGVNDRFSIMGAKAAEAYFNAYERRRALLEAGCPLHPESIQLAALEEAGCLVSNTLLAEFTCLRLTGAGEHVPLVEYPGEMAAFIAALK